MFRYGEETQRMIERQRLLIRPEIERVKELERKFEDATLVSQGSETIQVSVDSPTRKIPVLMLLPKERKFLSPAIIIIHDLVGVTSHTQLLGSRLALAGYVVAIPSIVYAGKDHSWEALEPYSQELIFVLNYLKSRPEIDKYLIGCLGFGVGGTLCLKLATRSQYIRACFTLHADPPSLDKLQTMDMRALLSFNLSSEDHLELEHEKALREKAHRSFVTTGPNRNLRFGGGGTTHARRYYFDPNSPNYDERAAKITQNNILLFFDQELLADRSNLPESDGQIGMNFSRLSSAEKEQYLERMEKNPRLAEEVADGFFGSLWQQLDEDIAILERLAKTNKSVAKGRAGALAANFRYYSEDEKRTFLSTVRESEESTNAFLESVSHALEDETKQLSKEERTRIFELALTSPENMRSFAFGKGVSFTNLSVEDQKDTLAFVSDPSTSFFEGHDMREVPSSLRKEFARGLGQGVSIHFGEVNVGAQVAIRRLFDENQDFAEGLMEGFHLSYMKAAEEERDTNFWKYVTIPRFAEMIGVSIGLGFAKMPLEERTPFLDFATQSREFARNFGFGAGIVYKRLIPSDAEFVNMMVAENPEFRTGYEEARRSALFPQ